MLYLQKGVERFRQIFSPEKRLVHPNDFLNKYGWYPKGEQKLWLERQQEIIRERLAKPDAVFDYDFASAAAFYSGELAVREIETTIIDPSLNANLTSDPNSTAAQLLRQITKTRRLYQTIERLSAQDVLTLNTLSHRFMSLMYHGSQAGLATQN